MLEVEIVSDAVYRYRSVNRDVFDTFCSAPPKGRFFNRHITDAYPWDDRDEPVARPSG